MNLIFILLTLVENLSGVKQPYYLIRPFCWSFQLMNDCRFI